MRLALLTDLHANREALEACLAHAERQQADAYAFLADLPPLQRIGQACFVHASAHDPLRWEYVTGVDEAQRSLKASGARIVFSGHVHAPALYRCADDGRMGRHVPAPGESILLQPRHQYLVLPGAVGQPRDQNNAAGYAIFDDATREIRYLRVPYDHGAAARKVIAAGLPIVFAMRLVEGI